MLTTEGKNSHKLAGIFSAEVVSNKNLLGRGVAVFIDNVIYGGDAAFYYKGKCRYGDDNSFSAAVMIVDYSGRANSMFGPLKTGHLTLRGNINDQGFTLGGNLEGSPNSTIIINLKRLEGLVAA